MWEFIVQPWPWWFSGLAISATMFALILFGRSFGFSSNLRTLCAIASRRHVKFFDFDWKKEVWNLIFLVGAIVGGYLANTYLNKGEAVQISQATVQDLSALGFGDPSTSTSGVQPDELFSWENALSLKGFLILAVAGFLVGFGTRYAGGCTSGHAISGLSDLQIPSLVAVIGFFTGGLIMTHLLYPLIF
jgi:uncharacterized membrane protein YedE/YeeE